MKPSRKPLVKTITWRAVSVLLTLLIARLMGMPQDQANGFAVRYAVASSALYYLHEQLWSRFKTRIFKEKQ